MMLLHLVKKDILLVKKYLLITMFLVIAIPVFIMIQIPTLLGFSAFLISVIFAEFILCQYVLMAEMKYPKANALICATPYPRSMLVKARYAFYLLIFAYCCVAYNVLALLLPTIEYLTPYSVLITLLISVILFGVYTPVQYKLGYEKTKYFFSIVFVGIPFLLPLLTKNNIKLDLTGWYAMPIFVQYLIAIMATIAILCISMIVSTKIYSKKELL